MERTLCIIKPDAVLAENVGEILSILEREFRVVALRMTRLSRQEASSFYAVHRERDFFPELIKFMCSGPCVAVLLEGEDVISRYRSLMGPTDSRTAPEGTLRHRFGTNMRRNGVHGSDSVQSANHRSVQEHLQDCTQYITAPPLAEIQDPPLPTHGPLRSRVSIE